MGIRSLLRSAVIGAMIFSWLAISNHCTLAAVSARSNAAEICPMHSKSVPQKEQAGLICCKILRAQSAPAVVKVAVPQAPQLLLDPFFHSAVVRHADVREPAALALDTGPPSLFSFPESVLQRSLRAHAPPSLG